jgi:hypothetical protein
LDNLISLCSFHHHRHHDGAFTIAPGPAGWTFTRADGRSVPAAAQLPIGAVDPDPGIEPAVSDGTPAWEGGAPDLAWIVEGLLRREGFVDDAPSV